MDCDFRAAQQEVSMELSSSVLIWHVLMAKAGSSQQLRTPTTIPSVDLSSSQTDRSYTLGEPLCLCVQVCVCVHACISIRISP